jgi:hypothetical protein
MRTQSLTGVLALSLGLLGVAASANAWDRHDRHGRHWHGGSRFGLTVDVAPYYRAAPAYRYCSGYWDDRYGCWDGDYGYSAYYRSSYPYVDTYYAPAPRVMYRHYSTRHGGWSHGYGHQRHWR